MLPLIALALSLVMLAVVSIYSRRPMLICVNVALMAIFLYAAGMVSTTPAPDWTVAVGLIFPGMIYTLEWLSIWWDGRPIRSLEPLRTPDLWD